MIDLIDEWVKGVVEEGVGATAPVSLGPIEGVEKGLRLSLLGIAENLGARGFGFDATRPGTEGDSVRQERPVTIGLDYGLTAAPSDPKASAALGLALSQLLLAQNGAPPKLTAAMQEGGWISARISVAQPEHPLVRDASATWSALGVPLRPAIGIRVDAVLNPYRPVFVRLVHEAVIGLTPRTGDRDVEVRTIRASVAGQVVDGRSLEPIEGALVSPEHGPGFTTNPRGIFVLVGLPEGTSRLRATHPDYGIAEAEVEVSNQEGATAPTIRLALPPRNPAATRGRPVRTLASAEGEALPYRVVRSGPYSSVTDAEGRHALPEAES